MSYALRASLMHSLHVMEDESKEESNPTVVDLIDEKGFEGLSYEELDSCMLAACKPRPASLLPNDHQVVIGVGLMMERQRRLIIELEERNDRTQFWFKFLAIASLSVGVIALLISLAGLLWQIGVDTRLIHQSEYKDSSIQTVDVQEEKMDIPVPPKSSQPVKETNP